MANRVLRDWTDSEKVEKLTPGAEIFFTRLFMKADDFGAFYANPKLLKANLFPLRLESVSDADILEWTENCLNAGLLQKYQVNSKDYLLILNFGQRLRRMKGKFPLPEENPLTIDRHTLTNDSPKLETRNKKLETRNETSMCTSALDFKLMEFYKFRKEKKKPILESSKELFFKKLKKLSGGDENIAILILEESIANGWQGIFELKNNKNNGQTIGTKTGQEHPLQSLSDLSNAVLQGTPNNFG